MSCEKLTQFLILFTILIEMLKRTNYDYIYFDIQTSVLQVALIVYSDGVFLESQFLLKDGANVKTIKVFYFLKGFFN